MPASEPPTVSVVIPTKDRPRETAQAAATALAQSPPPMEVVVVDDASSTRERAELERLLPQDVRLVEAAGKGPAAARNVGLRVVRGDWIAFLDSDDRWLAGHLAAVRKAIAAHPEARVYFGASRRLSHEGRLLNLSRVDQANATLDGVLTGRIRPTPSATAVEAGALRQAGGFFEGFRHASIEDLDLWWRLVSRHRAAVEARPLVECRDQERRDRERSTAELEQLGDDYRLFLARVREGESDRLFRLAAAEVHASMARHWYAAGFRREGLSEAGTSLRHAVTVSGLQALVLGLLPHRAGDALRHWRRVALGRAEPFG